MTWTATCSNCQASLQIPDHEYTQYDCPYCGITTRLRGDAKTGLKTGLNVAQTQIAVVGLAIMVGGWLLYDFLSERGRKEGLIPDKISLHTKHAGVFPTGTLGATWLDSFSAPIAANVNADGIEDFIGPYALREGASLTTYVGAFDGKTFERIWSVGPFGARDIASRKTKIAVAGGRVLVLDSRSQAHLYEMKDGKAVKNFAFPSADGLCSPQSATAEQTIWVRAITPPKNGYFIDGLTGNGKAGDPPSWCRDARRRPADSGDSGMTYASILDFKAITKVPGMRWSRAIADGPDGVAIGTLTGSDEPYFVGFDTTTKAFRWQKALKAMMAGADNTASKQAEIPALTDLYERKFYWQYRDGQVTRLAALDAVTGLKLWDASLPPGLAATTYTLGSSRIYLVRQEDDRFPVDVLDSKTGAFVGSLGGSPDRGPSE
ncbi:MAG: hypothetical protein ABIP39_08210 [Polyangiaceae bacterium]